MSWSPVGVKGLLIKQGQNLKASVTHYQSNILSNFCHFYPYEEYSHLRSTLTLKLLITQHFQCGDTPSCSWCVPLLLLHFDIALIFYRKDAWHHGIYHISSKKCWVLIWYFIVKEATQSRAMLMIILYRFHSSWSLKNSNNSRSSNSSDVLVPLLLWKWGRRGHCLFERGACLTLSPRGWVLIQGNAVFFN